MRRLLYIALLLPTLVRASVSEVDTLSTALHLRIDNVEVVSQRPMRDIGVQKTLLDTLVLHENIALSLADVLSQNSTIFIKSYGRATLSTASFRGTSPSHTQVSWNGMKITSPMLGMTDFSMIPSYFIDETSLLHGTSSVSVTGGGLGGAISLATRPTSGEGWDLRYIQGIGSFTTFDEFLRVGYSAERWQSSTRVVLSTSKNDFRYTNYRRKVNTIYDENRNLISFDYPEERNRNGEFRDLHILQEFYYKLPSGDQLSLAAWYVNSNRGVPMLNVDTHDSAEFENNQREQTLRSVLSWERIADHLRLSAQAGYLHTTLKYDYRSRTAQSDWAEMIRSRSKVNTLHAQAEVEYHPLERLMISGNVALYQHFVRSEDKNVIRQDGMRDVVGYDKARVELSAYVTAKWRPTERLGLSVALRENLYGRDFTPIIPAAFIDFVASHRGNVVLKASISRNHRYPTLNDLYFQPGGNKDLRIERGFTYDGGVSFAIKRDERFSLSGEVTLFDSYINDWIIWLPTAKGFWSPQNIKRVHAYGAEVKLSTSIRLADEWRLALDGNFSWTPSINQGDRINWADQSIGKQLPYVPRTSAAVTGRLSWRDWSLLYKWNYYGERTTTSSGKTRTRIGRLAPYFMNDVSIERKLSVRWADFSFKGAVNNLFNEEYESVLSRPMPGINFEIFIGITPKFKR